MFQQQYGSVSLSATDAKLVTDARSVLNWLAGRKSTDADEAALNRMAKYLLDMVKDTRAYAIMVAQYVEALVNVGCTYSELRRALRMIRRDRTDRFWPTIAEVLAAARDARAILKAEERQQSPTLLPAPEPPRRGSEVILVVEDEQLVRDTIQAHIDAAPIREHNAPIDAEIAKLEASVAALKFRTEGTHYASEKFYAILTQLMGTINTLSVSTTSA